MTTRAKLSLLGLLLLAAALRLVAAHNDLWLDELVSIRFANLCRNPGEVFTRFKVDNNHYLYTLYLHFLTDAPLSSIPYRLPSILAGIATVAVAFYTGRDRPTTLRLLFALLITLNYPLIHFSSEARGYSLAAFAGLLAYAEFDRWLDTPTRRGSAVILAAFVVGLMSHLTFCFIWAALFLWTLILIFRRPQDRAALLRRWAILQSLAVLFFIVFYLACVMGMRIPGGPLNAPAVEVARFLSFSLGIPWPVGFLFWIVLALFVVGLLRLGFKCSRDRSRCLLYLLVLLPPIAYILIARPMFVFSRYLMVTSPFLCEALAMMAYYLATTRLHRTLFTAALAASLLGHLFLFTQFLRVGRGHIADAARLMGDRTPGNIIYLASAQWQRLAIEEPYAQRFLPQGKAFRTQPDPGEAAVPEWYIYYSSGFEPPGIPNIRSQTGDLYHRIAYYPCSYLSGQAWTVYRRESPATAASRPQ